MKRERAILSNNPLDDLFNTEISHEQLFFEDGGAPLNLGYFSDGTLKTESDPVFSRWPWDRGYRRTDGGYNDCLMRMAMAEARIGDYSLLGGRKPKNNCQDWAERVRQAYERLLADRMALKECGL